MQPPGQVCLGTTRPPADRASSTYTLSKACQTAWTADYDQTNRDSLIGRYRPQMGECTGIPLHFPIVFGTCVITPALVCSYPSITNRPSQTSTRSYETSQKSQTLHTSIKVNKINIYHLPQLHACTPHLSTTRAASPTDSPAEAPVLYPPCHA